MRTKRNYNRTIDPDQKYDSALVTKLINRSMRSGKKSVARKHVYQALESAAKKLDKTPVEVLEDVTEAVSPKMEVRSRRVGGASYQVPTPVRAKRATSLAIRWIVLEANKRPNAKYHAYSEKLEAEILDALKGEGGAINKRNSSHRMAEANKAFAHFRW